MRWQKIYLDKKKRTLFKNFEVRLIGIKSLLKFRLINNFEYKNQLLKQLYLYKRDCFFNRINNICIFTGRHSSVYRLFRVSRIELRRSASQNDIFGLKKSSW
jgi:ribosomal protein S14